LLSLAGLPVQEKASSKVDSNKLKIFHQLEKALEQTQSLYKFVTPRDKFLF